MNKNTSGSSVRISPERAPHQFPSILIKSAPSAQSAVSIQPQRARNSLPHKASSSSSTSGAKTTASLQNSRRNPLILPSVPVCLSAFVPHVREIQLSAENLNVSTIGRRATQPASPSCLFKIPSSFQSVAPRRHSSPWTLGPSTPRPLEPSASKSTCRHPGRGFFSNRTTAY